MTEIVRELIEFIKNASPQLWAILIRQAYTEATAKAIWAIALLAACYASVRLARHFAKLAEGDSDWGQIMVVTYISAFICGVVAFSMLIGSIMWFINPEFYAIRFILQSITAK